MTRVWVGTLLAGLAWVHQATAGQAFLHLDVGDPERRGREVPLVLDAITDTATGAVITPAEMATRLADTGLLFIGENHDDQAFHVAQLRTIQALHDAGREVLIGLEMLPYTAQASLDSWNSRQSPEADFVDQARWNDHWNYSWNYYRDIFRYAQATGSRLYAVNCPREAVGLVRSGGFDKLTPEQATHLPPELALESSEHQQMYRALFAEGDLHHGQDGFAGLYRVQTLWDACMGWNALEARKKHGGPQAIMVVLLGAGHVAYGLGAERQIQPYFNGRISSLIPVPVLDSTNQPVREVRASYANFLWGLPRQTKPLYPLTRRPRQSASGE